jgi:hypothetical protein
VHGKASINRGGHPTCAARLANLNRGVAETSQLVHLLCCFQPHPLLTSTMLPHTRTHAFAYHPLHSLHHLLRSHQHHRAPSLSFFTLFTSAGTLVLV